MLTGRVLADGARGGGVVGVSLDIHPLVRGRGGWPWHVSARACDGTASAEVDRAANDGTVRVRFEALDLVPCLASLAPRGAVAGRASGDAALALTAGTSTGGGTLTLAGASWLPEGMPRHLALIADQATVRWRLDGALHLDDFTLTNEEYTATGSGLVRLRPPPAAPEIDQAQYETRSGSCLESFATGDVIVDAGKFRWRRGPAGRVATLTIEGLLEERVDEVSLDARGNSARICVRDRGPGVPEAELARIFEPFYRTDKSRDHRQDGQGIGLAITTRVMELHGGTVNAKNRAEGGLEITLELPLGDAARG